jgi:dTMP kinase
VFITFEGGEGAGKTTLIEAVFAEFKKRGKDVLLTRAPGGTKVGALIRECLLSQEKLSSRTELFLFLADRADHTEQVIRPALAQKKIVLCDRFNDSTLAYQAGARGFDSAFVLNLCHFATQNLNPDLTLYLDADPHIALARLKRSKDRIEQEELSFHQKLRAAYLEIAKKEPKRVHILNAEKPPQDVYQEAAALLDPYWG